MNTLNLKRLGIFLVTACLVQGIFTLRHKVDEAKLAIYYYNPQSTTLK